MGVFSVYFGVDALTALKESQCFFLSGFFSEKTPLVICDAQCHLASGPKEGHRTSAQRAKRDFAS